MKEKQTPDCSPQFKEAHGLIYKEGQKVLLYHPDIAVGTTSNFKSNRKGPFIIEKCLNDVTFRIKQKNTSKQQIVLYDQLKPFFEPPPTSNVPTRNKRRNVQSTQDIAHTYIHINGTFNQDDCLSVLPAPSSVFTPIPPIRRATASIPTS